MFAVFAGDARRPADSSAALVGFNLNFNTLMKAALMGLFKRWSMPHLHCFAALDANVSTSPKWRIFANRSHFSASYKMPNGVTAVGGAERNLKESQGPPVVDARVIRDRGSKCGSIPCCLAKNGVHSTQTTSVAASSSAVRARP